MFIFIEICEIVRIYANHKCAFSVHNIFNIGPKIESENILQDFFRNVRILVETAIAIFDNISKIPRLNFSWKMASFRRRPFVLSDTRIS